MAITPLMPVYPRSPVRPVRGEGVYLFGEGGEKYLDFASGIAVNMLGHGHPHLTEAIQDQAAQADARLQPLRQPAGRSAGAAAGRSDLRRHGVLHQFGRRGGRMRDQDRAALPSRQGQSPQARADHLLERLPRPDDGDDQRDQPGKDPRRLRAAAAGLHGSRVRRSRSGQSGDERAHRRLPGRADPGRRRHPPRVARNSCAACAPCATSTT